MSQNSGGVCWLAGGNSDRSQAHNPKVHVVRYTNFK